jgi:hypothetical protein
MSSIDEKRVDKDTDNVSSKAHDIFHSDKLSSLVVRQRFFDIFRKGRRRA